MPTPLVTIIIPVYNAIRHLEESVSSILGQTYGNLQIICIDDGSTDGSGALLDQLAETDSRLEIVHIVNQGLVHALNLALSLAKGTLIGRMDADDISAPDRIQQQVAYLLQHPAVGMLGSQILIATAEGCPVKESRFVQQHAAIKQALHKGMCPLAHPAILARSEVFKALKGYRNLTAEDYDLFLRAAEITEIANLPETLLLYRESDQGLKHTALERNHLSILQSLSEVLTNGNQDQEILSTIQSQLLHYRQRMQKPHALTRKQLRAAWDARNILSVKKLGRKLWKARALDRKSFHRWMKAEAACRLGKGNSHQKLLNHIRGTGCNHPGSSTG